MPTITANAVDDEDLIPTNESSFTFDDATGNITRYTGDVTDVVIPSTIGGVEVTTIGDSAFSSNSTLTSVYILASVTTIDDYAFAYCILLTDVTIPNSVTSIGIFAFGYCISLTDITIPANVNSIGETAFYNCQSLESATIINAETNIGYDAFGMSETEIPSTITLYGIAESTAQAYAEEYQENGFDNIKFAEIMSGTYEDSNTNTDITWIYVPETKTLKIIGTGTIPSDLYEQLGVTIQSEMETVVIQDGITFISEGAFTDCTSLNTIIIDKLKSECTEMNIPDDSSINVHYAIALNNNLTNITSDNPTTKISYLNTSDYATTLSVDEGYKLPDDVTITIGGVTLTDGYTFEDGVLTIEAEKLTDDITIEAKAIKLVCTVTPNVTNIDFDGADTVENGTEYKATLTADKGYTLPKDITIKVGDTVLTSGYTFVDGVLNIDAKNVTGDITITATAEKVENSTNQSIIDLLKVKKHILEIPHN